MNEWDVSYEINDDVRAWRCFIEEHDREPQTIKELDDWVASKALDVSEL